MSVAANATPMLDAEQLAILVDRFYEKVRADVLLGAVFNPVVHDWEAHKRLLTSFWVGVVLRAGTYRGNPLGMHRPHPIRREHFARWLALWEETCREIFDACSAQIMIDYAQRIGTGMQLGLGLLEHQRDRVLGLPLQGADA
ncbi:MAG: group III truncated hemoglobin [Dokdonella sp.]